MALPRPPLPRHHATPGCSAPFSGCGDDSKVRVSSSCVWVVREALTALCHAGMLPARSGIAVGVGHEVRGWLFRADIIRARIHSDTGTQTCSHDASSNPLRPPSWSMFLPSLTSEIMLNAPSRGGAVAGGFLMAWNDERWKGCKVGRHGTSFVASSHHPLPPVHILLCRLRRGVPSPAPSGTLKNASTKTGPNTKRAGPSTLSTRSGRFPLPFFLPTPLTCLRARAYSKNVTTRRMTSTNPPRSSAACGARSHFTCGDWDAAYHDLCGSDRAKTKRVLEWEGVREGCG